MAEINVLLSQTSDLGTLSARRGVNRSLDPLKMESMAGNRFLSTHPTTNCKGGHNTNEYGVILHYERSDTSNGNAKNTTTPCAVWRAAM